MAHSSGSQPYVLVVDDEEHISEMVAMGLGFNGFEVERASSGRGALDSIVQRRPDLVVLDVMLPDLDGFEVARRLRQSEGAGTRVPVIFLTARDATQDKVEGLRLGSDDYVTKPFSIEELIERVKAVLRRAWRGVQPSTPTGQLSRREVGAKSAQRRPKSAQGPRRSPGFSEVPSGS